MTAPVSSRQIVSSFLTARQDPDADASALMDEAFTFESPLMRIGDRDAYLKNHRSFQTLVTGMKMISELYELEEAMLLYDLETATPAGVQRTAEHFRVRGGKVSSIVMLFDTAPWRSVFENTDST